MEEVWKEIPGFEGYLISNLGRIKSFLCKGPGATGVIHKTRFRFLTLYIKQSNATYRSVTVKLYSSEGTYYSFVVSRLLYEIFISPIPIGYVVDHKDGDPLNNDLINLRLATRTENCRNRVKCKTKTNDLPKGVFLKGSRFCAAIGVNKKQIWLGNFSTVTEATDAYNKAAISYYGEFAKLNITDSKAH